MDSKHENADDCYEAQNIQVAGIATPQDEMQKQKEVYALRMYQQRNLGTVVCSRCRSCRQGG